MLHQTTRKCRPPSDDVELLQYCQPITSIFACRIREGASRLYSSFRLFWKVNGTNAGPNRGSVEPYTFDDTYKKKPIILFTFADMTFVRTFCRHLTAVSISLRHCGDCLVKWNCLCGFLFLNSHRNYALYVKSIFV